MNNNWYKNGRRRYFLDFHIDDWDDEYLSKFDPEDYAQSCLESGATAATFMANTHSGLINWPSKVGGRMHKAFVGRDMLQETIDALHKRGLDCVVYYVFTYVIDYWEKHPEARFVREDGRVVKQRIGAKNGEPRFATVCFNDPGYRKYAMAELEEICRNYDFEGLWPDMTFWPGVCYCKNCQDRYRRETGKELPRIIQWNDPDFVEFVRVRQRWLYEFCREISDLIYRLKPGMKYAQQSQTVNMDWVSGASAELGDVYDWMSADLYCDRYGLSYSSKLFYAMSKEKPFERVNCWNYPNIHEHVITRTRDEMNMIAYNTIMHDGALTVIDQIDPLGTIHHRNYRMMQEVFGNIKKYEPYLGGKLRADVGLYVSHLSNFDKKMNGKHVEEAGLVFEWQSASSLLHSPEAHMKSVLSAAKTLTMFHIPYHVVTKKNLQDLSDYKVLILSNVVMMDETELAAVREFVRKGGKLYASKDTATIAADGRENGHSLLENLFGVRILGETDWNFTYVSPAADGAELYPEAFAEDYPVTVADSQKLVEILPEAALSERGELPDGPALCESGKASEEPASAESEMMNGKIRILGTLTLPYDAPNVDRYAALFTYPPGQYLQNPAVTEHAYGEGTAMYSSAVLEMGDHHSQREFFARLIHHLTGSCCTEIENYPSLEAVRFEKIDRSVIHILNYQQELPNIPVYNLEIRVATDGRQIREIKEEPAGSSLPWRLEPDCAVITVPQIRDYTLFEIFWE